MIRKNPGFTILEIVVVVIIMTVLLALAIPRFVETFERTDERNMISNLKSLRAAMDIYLNKGWTIPAGGWGPTVGAVNAGLGLSITDPNPNMSYTCGTVDDGTNGCTIEHPIGWALEFNDDESNGLIHCTDGSCPTCPAQPNNCE